MTTAERLVGYYPFQQDVIDTVSEHAEIQQNFGIFQGYLRSVGIDVNNIDKKTSILDIKPRDFDDREALLLYLPHANVFDAGQLVQIGTIAGTNPDRRIIAAANPGAPGYNANRLHMGSMADVAGGNFSATNEGLKRFISSEEIETTDQYAASYGINRLLALMHSGVVGVRSAVMFEPVTVVDWQGNPFKLGSAFKKSEKRFDEYVTASQTPIYEQARDKSVGKVMYGLGLLRLSNIASTFGMTHGDFEDNLEQALDQHSDAYSTLAWGTASEVGDDVATTEIAENYDDVEPIRLVGHGHAAMNDIHLQAAVVLQGTRNN